jgi:hypothetical protein
MKQIDISSIMQAIENDKKTQLSTALNKSLDKHGYPVVIAVLEQLAQQPHIKPDFGPTEGV